MRWTRRFALLSLLLSASMLKGQAAPASPVTNALPPSVVVGPATSAVKQALTTASVDHWKLSRAARDSTSGNLDSIARDINETLPGLLTTADSLPPAGSTSQTALLPVTRNLTALYEVLLRVTVTAEASAPKDQISALEGALSSVQSARHTLDDRAQDAALDEDRQISDLRKALAAAKAPQPAAATTPTPQPPCTTPRKKKPAARTRSQS